MKTEKRDAIVELADAVGLQTSYVDAWGRYCEVSRSTLTAVLDALGQKGDPDEALAAYRRRVAERLLPPAIVVRRGHPGAARLTLSAGQDDTQIDIRLRLEDGTEETTAYRVGDLTLQNQGTLDGIDYEARILPIQVGLPLGYHSLRVTLGERSAEALVIVAPERAWSSWKSPEERHWGIAVQLYAVRSSRNWGIGDFTDLAELMERASTEGASAVGVNPLHALYPDEPERVSPYSPSTRLYRNPLYLDIESIPEFARSTEAQELVSSYEFQRELGGLRAASSVAYASVALLKFRVLRLLYAAFEHSAPSQRRRAFAQFRTIQGPALRRFAIYERLRELRGAQDWGQRDWRNWPVELQNPNSPAVAEFARDEESAIGFAEYLQWQIEEQLTACLRRASSLAMPIGLYADLAVGVDAGGAEAWWNQEVVVRGLAIGAPPDAMSTQGQNWGLPLFNPVVLAERAYEPFIAVLRANMRHAGALRIDHILGLMRLWCVPEGNRAADGAYLTYPVEDLIAIVALESHRHRCVVIGEDLGTLPSGLGDLLRNAGILSYRVLYFERSGDAFKPAAEYPRNALVTVGTHDLPPLARWWHGDDLTLRASLGLIQPENLEGDRAHRLVERQALAEWVGMETVPEEPPTAAIHRTLANAPSRLLMVQLEDMLPEAVSLNLPGTSDQYPNWRPKLPADLSALFADRRVLDTLAAVAAVRPPSQARPAQARASIGPAIASPPRATYRLQLRADFTFADATALVPYLVRLGISHVYSSSFFRARPGSSHGYDITDHGMLNPEIGTEDDFKIFSRALKDAGIGLILDFVPNHMGIGHADNDLWLDVLEWGIASRYAKYFDIDWRSSRRLMRGKVLLPFLGDQYGAVLNAGGLQLRLDAEFGTFSIWYEKHRFPVRPADYPELLRASRHAGAQQLAEGFADLPDTVFRRNREGARQRSDALKQGVSNLAQTDPDALAAIQAALSQINEDARLQGANSALNRLIDRQHYRLAFWRVASDEINYRRFFDINELASIRVEDPEVFTAIHRGVTRLIGEGAIQGLRLDHIDGLAEPLNYLRRLTILARRYRPRPADRRLKAPPFYLAVEKILGNPEALRADWPIQGATGYEFINLVTWLYVDPAGRQALDATYAANGGGESFESIAYAAKLQVMDTMLASELTLLSEKLDRIAKTDLSTRDFGPRRFRAALTEIVAGMDVYRTYVTDDGLETEDRRRINAATARARRRWRGTDRSILDFVERVLTGDILADSDVPVAEVTGVLKRFQQYTGPVMAKAIEDTAFYRYNRLIALNEVGGEPTQFGISAQRFHDANIQRALRWPDAMLASSTHDTKRGEDARIRIAGLSEMAEDWANGVSRWTALDHRTAADAARPEANDAYLILQALIGSWPMEFVGVPTGALSRDAVAAFRQRLVDYAIKAVREAKLNTRWTDHNDGYERATTEFVERLTDPDGPVLPEMAAFQLRAARLGAAGSIAQTVLRMTVPGLPDIYQGAELWNLAMADPDNRRPVDYPERDRLLAASEAATAVDWSEESWRSGAVKLSVLHRLLAFRRRASDLFARGAYRPLEVSGDQAERLVVFQRRYGDTVLLVAAGRLMAPLIENGPSLRPKLSWPTLSVHLPSGTAWRDLLSDRIVPFGETVTAAELMGDAPVGLWVADNG